MGAVLGMSEPDVTRAWPGAHAEERVALALDAGRLGTWHWEVATGRLDWDEPLERVFAVEPGTFPGTFEAYIDLLHPDDRAATLAAIEQSLSARASHYVEHRVVLADGAVRWISGTGRVVLGEDGEPVAMVGVGADITARKLAEGRLTFLARAGQILGSSLDLETTLQQLCDLAVERLGDWCSVDLVEPGGVRLVAVAHRDPEKVAYARELRQRIGVHLNEDQGLAKVLRTGQVEVMQEIDEDFIRGALAQIEEFTAEDMDRFVALGLRSSVIVPLTGSGGVVLGALTLVTAESGMVFDDQDVALALEVARRAGTAVENAQLYARVEHAARTLQQSLLPPALPDLGFGELAAFYSPLGGADLIGGDFYDVFPVSDGRRWCLVIGDVSGKGVDAAALTAAVRWTLRSALARTGSPGRAILELNDALLQADLGGRFVTVAAVMLTPGDDGVRVDYACGGHPAPLVVRHDGRVEVLTAEGQIVGALPAVEPLAEQAWLAPGDALVLYSDGFTEVRQGAEMLGESGLVAALSGLTPGSGGAVIVERLRASAASYGPQRDDMAMLVLTIPTD
jgi:serine phosphatase RsbU (regulator of sigma subunit)